jgi:cell division transport system permease protein
MESSSTNQPSPPQILLFFVLLIWLAAAAIIAGIAGALLPSTWPETARSGLTVTLLAAVLGVALVAVTFNTIRLQILTQEAEIEVSRLLGATDTFIRRPFFYFGALQGLAGGGVAWCAALGASLLLRAPVSELASLYGIEFTLHIFPLADSALLFGLAALLGWAGAWLSLTRYLRG